MQRTKNELRDLGNSANTQIKTTLRQGQQWVKDNKQPLLKQAKNIQDLGEGMTIFGAGAAVVGAPFAGVGAAPGVAIAKGGGIVSLIGTGMEIGVNFISGDNENAKTGLIMELGSELLSKGLDRLIPGPNPNMDEASKKIFEEGIKVMKTNNKVKVIGVEKGVEKYRDKE